MIVIRQSPYDESPPDYSAIPETRRLSDVDLTSIADVLRNAFVCPPYSVWKDVRVLTTGLGISPSGDTVFAPPPAPGSLSLEVDETDGQLVSRYHSLLRDAIRRSTARSRNPWLLQSGGKDSTSLCIALAEERPDAVCITYLGGEEENEIESARFVAKRLGLKHFALTCDVERAYDRYIAIVPQMPLLTADFALLSYVDLTAEISANGGDSVIDGLGSDIYFGTPVSRKLALAVALSRALRLPPSVSRLPILSSSFLACYALGTLQMSAFERFFPGSRFSGSEVDAILGGGFAEASMRRLSAFGAELRKARSLSEKRRLAVVLAEGSAAFAKGYYSTVANGLGVAYPFCDPTLCDWLSVAPRSALFDENRGVAKIIVRRHIERNFKSLPYVSAKGSFRFDVRKLALRRFDQVYEYATVMRDVLPGARTWLEKNRGLVRNKYHASRFYLLAVVLPWLASRARA